MAAQADYVKANKKIFINISIPNMLSYIMAFICIHIPKKEWQELLTVSVLETLLVVSDKDLKIPRRLNLTKLSAVSIG
jgi:hypothetical protein